MNKYLHEIHDSSKAAAELGAKILATLSEMQEAISQLSLDVKSLQASDGKISVLPESAIAAQPAGLVKNEVPVVDKTSEMPESVDDKAKQATTEVDVAASHTIRK